MKAVFGGSQKKPLMTKVSMRHLNEIVRERNQYSRDALEAWQDFINLKGRMDTELGKVTKRNNFLVEELESWKQQFLKFQAFAEQLTKETQDLKVKIESHKREARRLTTLIDQQKDDATRLSLRLSGTEKQRDDALEALVLQQEIAEELERERKRNKKELSALQHTNSTILRQRDEAQRVVIHLRSLISGQAHHVEHIVQTLGQKSDLQGYIENGYGDETEDLEERQRQESRLRHRTSSRTLKRRSQAGGASPDLESRLYNNTSRNSKRQSGVSIIDVADRHLREKTNDIADIIRNISEQCAAAVEGLQLAHDAEVEVEDDDEDDYHNSRMSQNRQSNLSTMTASDDGNDRSMGGSETGDESLLQPTGRLSSIPPTPDLIHNRSSTSMSIASSTTTPERGSQQYEIPTKIVEDDDEELAGRSDTEGHHETTYLHKGHTDSLIHRPAGARISALGGA